MKLILSKAFNKKYSKYDAKLKRNIFDAIKKIPDGDIKQLTGNDVPPLQRLRVSKYRIIFQIVDDELRILKIDSRGDIYK